MSYKNMFGWIVLILVVTPLVDAIGIAPGRATLNYLPGETLEGSFAVVNSERDAIKVHLEVDGPLQPFLQLEVRDFTLQKEESRTITYAISLPEVLPQEKLDTMIVAQDVSKEQEMGETSVIARPGVATQIAINFLKMPQIAPQEEMPEVQQGSLQLIDAAVSQESDVVDITMANEGGQVLREVIAELIIYGAQQQELLKLTSDAYVIQPNEKVKTRIPFDLTKVTPGSYQAKLRLHAGEKVIEKELTITVAARVEQVHRSATWISTVAVALIAILILQAFIYLIVKRRGKPPVQKL